MYKALNVLYLPAASRHVGCGSWLRLPSPQLTPTTPVSFGRQEVWLQFLRRQQTWAMRTLGWVWGIIGREKQSKVFMPSWDKTGEKRKPGLVSLAPFKPPPTPQ